MNKKKREISDLIMSLIALFVSVSFMLFWGSNKPLFLTILSVSALLLIPFNILRN